MSVSEATQLRANAAPTPRRSGPDAKPKRTRRRAVDGRTVDGRCVQAKRWRALCVSFNARTNNRHPELVASLATLLCERERLDCAVQRAEPVDTDLLMRLSGEIRRIMTRLGLDEEPAEDATEQVIAMLRAGREQEAAP